MRLEEERRRVEQEAARLEAERMEAIIAKEELARQAEDQLRSQEQLVSARSLLHPRNSGEPWFFFFKFTVLLLSILDEMFLLRLQAAELAEYSVKISLLEEAKRSKEEEAESWHSKVSFQNKRGQVPSREGWIQHP